MTNPTNLPDHHFFRGFPQHAEPTPPRAQLVAGLGAALTVMLIAEAMLGLVLVQPMLFLLLAMVTIGLTLVLGTPLAIFLDQRTRRFAHARATLVFAGVAFVLFGVWGGLLGFSLVTWLGSTPAYQEAGVIVSPALGAAFGGVYLGSTFALGAAAGRFIGPALSLRRKIVVACWIGVAVVLAVAIFFWFFTQFTQGA